MNCLYFQFIFSVYMSLLSKLPRKYLIIDLPPSLYCRIYQGFLFQKDTKTGLFFRSNFITQELVVKYFILQYLVTVHSCKSKPRNGCDLFNIMNSSSTPCTAVPAVRCGYIDCTGVRKRGLLALCLSWLQWYSKFRRWETTV